MPVRDWSYSAWRKYLAFKCITLSLVLVVLVFSSDIGTELVTIETTRRGGSSGYRRCRCRTLLYLTCIFRLRTETIWVLIFVIRNHYGPLICEGFYCSTCYSQGMLCHIRYPHGEMAFIGIYHPVSCQKLSYCCNCSLSLHTYMTPRGTKMYAGRRTNQIIGAPSIFMHPICENLNPLHISLIIWT